MFLWKNECYSVGNAMRIVEIAKYLRIYHRIFKARRDCYAFVFQMYYEGIAQVGNISLPKTCLAFRKCHLTSLDVKVNWRKKNKPEMASRSSICFEILLSDVIKSKLSSWVIKSRGHPCCYAHLWWFRSDSEESLDLVNEEAWDSSFNCNLIDLVTVIAGEDGFSQQSSKLL